jgi:hypothetical protein
VFADGFGDKMAIGERALVQRAIISFVATGDNTIVTGAAGKLITVLGLVLTVSAATNLTFKDGTGGTAISGAMTMAVGTPFLLPFDPVSEWFQTSDSGNLVLNQSGTAQVSGTVWFVQV